MHTKLYLKNLKGKITKEVWAYNIDVDLKKGIGYEDMDWIHLAQVRVQ
jgi:hypothetical protein